MASISDELLLKVLAQLMEANLLIENLNKTPYANSYTPDSYSAYKAKWGNLSDFTLRWTNGGCACSQVATNLGIELANSMAHLMSPNGQAFPGSPEDCGQCHGCMDADFGDNRPW